MSIPDSQYYPEMSQPERRALRLMYIGGQKEKCYYCKGSLRLDPPTELKQKKGDWEYFYWGRTCTM